MGGYSSRERADAGFARHQITKEPASFQKHGCFMGRASSTCKSSGMVLRSAACCTTCPQNWQRIISHIKLRQVLTHFSQVRILLGADLRLQKCCLLRATLFSPGFFVSHWHCLQRFRGTVFAICVKAMDSFLCFVLCYTFAELWCKRQSVLCMRMDQ